MAHFFKKKKKPGKDKLKSYFLAKLNAPKEAKVTYIMSCSLNYGSIDFKSDHF